MRTKNHCFPIPIVCILILICFSIRSASQTLTNPILAGFYPDPSICQAGDDYYIVNSSFAYFPGLPIFHSKDLLNWKQIGHALDRPEQLNLDGAGVSRGLFAPAISYHKGTFYIVCTLIDKLGNFVITATDPKGPWSNPVALPQVNGIDPSLFFDDNGSSYILYNSIPPDNISIHDGHRTIRMFEFDAKNLKVTGTEKLLINGGTDMAKKPVWIEGPHIIRKDGWYYLICAEGGTGYNHSEVVFRSQNIYGPYVPYKNNPILTQRHLDPSRKDPITTTGHADFVTGPDGKWWAVFLGCRPYDGEHYNTGRETFMAPVEWIDGWPVINPGKNEVQYSYPINAVINTKAEKFSGNYLFRDDFSKKDLNDRYCFLRTLRKQWFTISNGKLNISLQPETISGQGNPSFVGFRQPHLEGDAFVSMTFDPKAENERAGLIVFQSENHFYYLCRTMRSGKQVVQLLKGPGNNKRKEPAIVLAEVILSNLKNKASVFFRIEARKNLYNFYFAVQKKEWKLLATADATFLSTKTAGGFVGSIYGMYATSENTSSTNVAKFDLFEVKSVE